MISDTNKDILVGVDGGITRDNIADIARMDVDIIVTGSAVFNGKAPLENTRFMINAVNDAAKKA
jgi:ribulose-phosphate 3-epimerase